MTRDYYPEITERFARETADHKMTVLLDQGLYRHLRFRDPKYSAYWFDLVTVPGALIFQGDGDAFVFRRLEDMFAFFRSGIHADGSRHINPGYWDEKLQADAKSVQRYSKAKFDTKVAEVLAEAEADHPGVTKAWQTDVVDGWEYDTEHGGSAREALRDFQFGEGYRAVCSCGARASFDYQAPAFRWTSDHIQDVNPADHRTLVESQEFTFGDDWHEWDLTDFHWWFLWACHAILFGVQQYDTAKAAESALAAQDGGESRG